MFYYSPAYACYLTKKCFFMLLKKAHAFLHFPSPLHYLLFVFQHSKEEIPELLHEF